MGRQVLDCLEQYYHVLFFVLYFVRILRVLLENIQHLAAPSVTVARATSSRVSGFGIRLEGKAGSSAPFAWKG